MTTTRKTRSRVIDDKESESDGAARVLIGGVGVSAVVLVTDGGDRKKAE